PGVLRVNGNGEPDRAENEGTTPGSKAHVPLPREMSMTLIPPRTCVGWAGAQDPSENPTLKRNPRGECLKADGCGVEPVIFSKFRVAAPAGETVSAQASGDVTALLRAWDQGRGAARDELIGLVYRELRRIAARSLASERRDHTLQPTALVHEAYERLADLRGAHFRDRAHFFAVAAGLMRRILVDHARRRRALRRAGPAEKVQLDENHVGVAAIADEVDVIALDGALNELAELDARQARVVELRFFAGLGPNEIAEATGVSRATVHRQWTMARAWLHRKL